MDEVLALQEQLAAVQQSSTSQRLSDRNVVELVMKLQQLSLIDLVFTRTGKEYLTHPQLVLEIKDEIQAQGGRVNLIDLPDVLNVDFHHIQAKMSDIIQPDQGVHLIRGEIITSYYLSTLVEEVSDALASSQDGRDEIGDIATRYVLPVDVVKKAFNSLKDSVDTMFDPASGTLRSSSSISRQIAAVRGALRGISTPTMLNEVAKHHGMKTAEVQKVTSDLLAKGHIHGAILGSGSCAILVPDLFRSAATNVVVVGFNSNGFARIDRMRKLFLSDIGGFVAENLSGAITLGQCVVGPVLIDTLANSAEEAIENDEWLDIVTSLPPDFPVEDVALIAERISPSLPDREVSQILDSDAVKVGAGQRKEKSARKKKGNAQKSSNIFGDRFVVSPNICEKCVDIVKRDANKKATERAKAIAGSMNVVVSHGAVAQHERGQKQSKDEGRKGKGRGKRRATGKDKSMSSASTPKLTDEDRFPVSVPSTGDVIDIISSEDSVFEVLQTDYLASSTDGNEMLECVIECLFEHDGLAQLYEAKAAEAVVALERERALAKQQMEKELLVGLEHAQLFSKSCTTLPSDDLVESSKTWVIDHTCLDVVCRVFQIVAENIGVRHPQLREATALHSKREKMDILREVSRGLPPTIEQVTRSLLTIVSGKRKSEISDILSLYDESTALLDLPERRPVDKKKENAAFANMRAQLAHSLEENCGLSETRALQAAAILAHGESCGGCVVSIPDGITESFCQAVEQNTLASPTGKALKELREAMDPKDVTEPMQTSSKWSAFFAEKMRILRECVG